MAKRTKKAPDAPKSQGLPDNVEILSAGEVLESSITDTLRENYMPYAMSVIVSRALPEIDGLKPSHRKLLYTMYDMGLLKGAKTKTFSVTQLTPEQRRLLEHSQTQDFRDRRRERYKIEAKNAHVKRGLGYGRAMFYGLDMMTVQCAVTMFVSNLKKIYTKIP